jgi:hypothetical protein
VDGAIGLRRQGGVGSSCRGSQSRGHFWSLVVNAREEFSGVVLLLCTHTNYGRLSRGPT